MMRVLLYRDKQGEWRWTLRAKNGRILANCGEGYKNATHCRTMARKLFPTALFSAEGQAEPSR